MSHQEKIKVNFKNDHEIAEDIYLWKYVDLHKFISLISSKSIYIARLDKFEDKREGITLKHLYFKKIKSVLDNNPIFDGIREFATVDSMSNYMNTANKELDQIQKSHYASCWVLTDKLYESAAMWNLYSRPNSIALKIKYHEFKKLVLAKGFENPAKDIEITCSPVKYINFQKTNFIHNPGQKELENSVFMKDSSFEHEKEFRIIAKENKKDAPPIKFRDGVSDAHIEKLYNSLYNCDGINLKLIDFENYPFEIVNHPQSKDYAKENIKNILDRFNLKFKLTDSLLEMK